MIDRKKIDTTFNEDNITDEFEPCFRKESKTKKSRFTIHREAKTIDKNRPEFTLSWRNKSDQYDYHVECKILRQQKKCSLYVTEGIFRYQSVNYYALSKPPMGTMIGYVLDGDLNVLFEKVNKNISNQSLNAIILMGNFKPKDVTHLTQTIQRVSSVSFILNHLWADFR